MANQKIRSREHVRKKWRRVGQYVGGVIAALLVTVAGLVGLTHWHTVQIQSYSVSVPDQSQLPEKQMEKLVGSIVDENLWGIINRNNIVLMPRGQITERINEVSPRIKASETDLTGLRTFQVDVQTRQAIGEVCKQEGENQPATSCSLVDKNGFVFAKADPQATSLNQLVYTTSNGPEVGAQMLPEETFTVLRSFLDNLPELGLSPERVHLQDRRDIKITVEKSANVAATTSPAVDIRLDLSDSLNQLYTDLKTVIQKDAFMASSSGQATDTEKKSVSPFSLEYIDLRFGNKVFYK